MGVSLLLLIYVSFGVFYSFWPGYLVAGLTSDLVGYLYPSWELTFQWLVWPLVHWGKESLSFWLLWSAHVLLIGVICTWAIEVQSLDWYGLHSSSGILLQFVGKPSRGPDDELGGGCWWILVRRFWEVVLFGWQADHSPILTAMDCSWADEVCQCWGKVLTREKIRVRGCGGQKGSSGNRFQEWGSPAGRWVTH